MDIPKALGESVSLAARDIPLESQTLPAILKHQAQRHQKSFIEGAGATLSYRAAWSVAAEVAGKLYSTGIRKGHRIVVFLPNCMELLELFLGSGYLGAVLVPINTACRSAQLKHQINLSEPSAIITTSELIGLIISSDADLQDVKAIWLIDTDFDEKLRTGFGDIPLEQWERGDVALPEQDVKPHDPLAILYTSGTTGPSKGVVCPHAQFFWWGILTAEALGMRSDDRTYTILPMFHTNALNCLWQVLLTGATYCFGKRFSASSFLKELIATEATVTYMLGSIVYMMMKQPVSEMDQAHNVRVALSPATFAELTGEFFARFNICLLEGYGSTETNLVFSNRLGSYEPGSMGRLVPEFEAIIADEFDRPVSGDETGELLIRNNEPFSMASGYFRNPEATVSAWKNLWFHTGDRVRRDSNGVFYFVDRIKDSIRRRGENISSWEVEQALISHPGVKNAAVVGVPSELGEEEVMAFLIRKDSVRIELDEIVKHLESQIAYFAIPRYVEFLDTFPMTENGKVQKYVLRKRGVGPGTIVLDAKSHRGPNLKGSAL